MAGEREASVLFATYYTKLDEIEADVAADARWQAVIAARNEVAKQIEAVRTAGKIGSALDANVALYADGEVGAALKTVGDELRFVLITSDASLAGLAQAPADAVQSEIADLKIRVSVLEDAKCVRCWHRRPEVGSIEAHPELCGRCVSNVDGDGESRTIA